jgi:hypothetical protein
MVRKARGFKPFKWHSIVADTASHNNPWTSHGATEYALHVAWLDCRWTVCGCSRPLRGPLSPASHSKAACGRCESQSMLLPSAIETPRAMSGRRGGTASLMAAVTGSSWQDMIQADHSGAQGELLGPASNKLHSTQPAAVPRGHVASTALHAQPQRVAH